MFAEIIECLAMAVSCKRGNSGRAASANQRRATRSKAVALAIFCAAAGPAVSAKAVTLAAAGAPLEPLRQADIWSPGWNYALWAVDRAGIADRFRALWTCLIAASARSGEHAGRLNAPALSPAVPRRASGLVEGAVEAALVLTRPVGFVKRSHEPIRSAALACWPNPNETAYLARSDGFGPAYGETGAGAAISGRGGFFGGGSPFTGVFGGGSGGDPDDRPPGDDDPADDRAGIPAVNGEPDRGATTPRPTVVAAPAAMSSAATSVGILAWIAARRRRRRGPSSAGLRSRPRTPCRKDDAM